MHRMLGGSLVPTRKSRALYSGCECPARARASVSPRPRTPRSIALRRLSVRCRGDTPRDSSGNMQIYTTGPMYITAHRSRFGAEVLRVLDPITHVHDVRGLHDQAVAQMVEGLEYHEGTGWFIREPHLLGAQGRHRHKALVRVIGNDLTVFVYGQHIARREPVGGAAIDGHHLVLTDDGHAVGYGNDAAAGLGLRSARNEIELDFDAAG